VTPCSSRTDRRRRAVSLTEATRHPTSLSLPHLLWSRLKTHFFHISYSRLSLTLRCYGHSNCLSYLFTYLLTYPAPDVTVHLAGRDVTNAFTFAQKLQFAYNDDDDDDVGVGRPHKALRRLRYVTERRQDALRLTAEDDGKLMECVATVAGLGANKTSAHIIVHCE